MTTADLIPDLMRDEGCRLTAYQDTLGIWTVGVGHAHVAPGTVWTQAQADAQLAADVASTEASLDIHLPWWRTLDDMRQDVIAEMGFNLGVSALCQFHNTLGAIQRGDWQAAHDGMLASLWARQVGARAVRLADQMLTGIHQP
jgi:lysozyme